MGGAEWQCMTAARGGNSGLKVEVCQRGDTGCDFMGIGFYDGSEFDFCFCFLIQKRKGHVSKS